MTGLTLWNKRFFDNLLDGFESELPGYRVNSYVPKADVVETGNEYKLSFELPGYEEKALNIEVKKGVLTVSGTIEQEEKSEEEGKFLLRERAVSSFKRAFNLPENADHSAIEAKLENGILYLNIAKKEEEQPRKITIQ